MPATLRTGSRNGPRKLDDSPRAVTMLKASSPQPSPPKEERERHTSCVVSIKLNGISPRPSPQREDGPPIARADELNTDLLRTPQVVLPLLWGEGRGEEEEAIGVARRKNNEILSPPMNSSDNARGFE